MIWIFMEGEGHEINSKQASKRDRTLLLFYKKRLGNFWTKQLVHTYKLIIYDALYSKWLT